MFAVYNNHTTAKEFYDRINTGCGYPKNLTIEHTPLLSYNNQWAIYLDDTARQYYLNDADEEKEVFIPISEDV